MTMFSFFFLFLFIVAEMAPNGLELTCGAAFCAQVEILIQLIERTFFQCRRCCQTERAAAATG
jgi:hypothetical protein